MDPAGWRLARFEFRAPGEKGGWPVARVELESPERGRVSDVASAPGELEAAFEAIGRIMRMEAAVREIKLKHAPNPGADPATGDESGPVSVEVVVSTSNGRHRGAAAGSDLIRCCLTAYVNALCESRREA